MTKKQLWRARSKKLRLAYLKAKHRRAKAERAYNAARNLESEAWEEWANHQ